MLTDLASVVICAKNRAGLIVETLESVLRNHPREIVVIDDQSTDDTGAVARRFTNRVIVSEGNGLGAARQLGATQVTCKYVVYVDSDVVLEDGCIATLVQALEADGELGAASAARQELGPGSYWFNSARQTRGYLQPPVSPYRQSFPCATVAIRRQLILDIGFDPFFVGAAEDLDFSTRLHAAGWRILRCSDAVVRHQQREGFIELVKQQIWYGRGAARLRYKRDACGGVPARLGTQAGWTIAQLIRDRRLSLLPCLLVTGGAYRLGRFLEHSLLRLLPAAPHPEWERPPASKDSLSTRSTPGDSR